MEANEISSWIRQPNRVTYARYEFNEVQENILTLMMEQLQKYLSEEMPINRDLFDSPFLYIDMRRLSEKRNNYNYIKNQAYQMLDLKFHYVSLDNKKDEGKINILSSMHFREKRKIFIGINPEAIPFLVYYGNCVVGKYTHYNAHISIKLRGYIAKRIYKFLSSWKHRGATKITIGEFKRILVIENKYNQLSEIRRLLNKTRNKFQNYTDLSFEFSFDKKKTVDESYITFLVFPKSVNTFSSNTQIKRYEQFRLVYNILSHWFPGTQSDFALTTTHKIVENEKLTLAQNRLKNMYNQYQKKEKSAQDCRNNILTNCLADWEIKMSN